MRDQAIALLKELCLAHGAPSEETQVQKIFQKHLNFGDHHQDGMGSVYFEPKGTKKGPRVLVTGHMDEVGFCVQHITPEGYIKFVALGGWWTHVMLAQRVRILTRSQQEVLGVISSLPPHFLSEAQRKDVMPIESLYIDVGAESAQQVREWGISLGDTIVPSSEFTPLKNPNYFMCKAFDNRVGMGLTIQSALLLKGVDLPVHAIYAGTCQEEVGVRGAGPLAHAVKPDYAIVLEGTPADDTPGFNRDEAQGRLGRGVQIRVMDPTAIMNRKLLKFTEDIARKHAIPHQIAVRRSGGTDARGFQASGQGVATIVLGVPARYIHTHNTIIDINDYLSALKLVTEMLKGAECF